ITSCLPEVLHPEVQFLSGELGPDCPCRPILAVAIRLPFEGFDQQFAVAPEPLPFQRPRIACGGVLHLIGPAIDNTKVPSRENQSRDRVAVAACRVPSPRPPRHPRPPRQGIRPAFRPRLRGRRDRRSVQTVARRAASGPRSHPLQAGWYPPCPATVLHRRRGRSPTPART